MKVPVSALTVFTILTSTLSSCGVMFGGSKYSAAIIAKDHPKAEIYVDGKKIGKGTAIELYRRSKPLTVELRQEGCLDKIETFNNAFRTGNFILSCISWGLTGLIIDLSTGAAFKPDHRGNPAIERLDPKSFIFMVDYSGCPNK